MNTKEEVQKIFQDVFEDDSIQVNETTNAADIEDWDSVANIDLVMSMEKKFDVRFNLEDIQELENVGDMIRLIDSLRKQ